MKLLLVLVSTLLLSSCASLFNPEDCRTDFRSPVPRTVLIDSTTIQVQPGKATPVAFVRGNQTKEAVLITDTIEVRPRWSEAYYLNFATCGVGFLFDGKTPKKWKYPSTLRLTDRYIDRHRKGADPYADYRYADKGSWNLHISLPYANVFYSAYGKESLWGAGFLGLSLGCPTTRATRHSSTSPPPASWTPKYRSPSRSIMKAPRSRTTGIRS